MEDKEDFIKSAKPIIENQVEFFAEGFSKAVLIELEKIKDQVENLKNGIKSSNLGQ
jgi:hypothetical protein